MNIQEITFSFSCEGSWLYGVISLPEELVTPRGVLIVVGGPQYGVGSHRQFTLLARDLASHGVPVMRFDYRGMGDSEGDIRDFENINNDLRCAINQFFAKVKSLKELVIWSLCDAASAALFYAYQDSRITGIVLLNPWVRTDEGIAKARLKHYYFDRIFDSELWKKILKGNFKIKESALSFLQNIKDYFFSKKENTCFQNGEIVKNSSCSDLLPERMMHGFQRFEGKVLLITSGNDLTAQEFTDLVKNSPKWQKLIQSSNVQCSNFPEADHTFSRKEWRDQVSAWTNKWIKSW